MQFVRKIPVWRETTDESCIMKYLRTKAKEKSHAKSAVQHSFSPKHSTQYKSKHTLQDTKHPLNKYSQPFSSQSMYSKWPFASGEEKTDEYTVAKQQM